MATFTVQLPNFKAKETHASSEYIRHSPLCGQKASKQHKQAQNTVSSTRWKPEEMLLFSLSLETSYLSTPQLSAFLLCSTIIYQFTDQIFNTLQSLLIKQERSTSISLPICPWEVLWPERSRLPQPEQSHASRVASAEEWLSPPAGPLRVCDHLQPSSKHSPESSSAQENLLLIYQPATQLHIHLLNPTCFYPPPPKSMGKSC